MRKSIVIPVKPKSSNESVADSTHSNASPEHFEEPRRQSRRGSTYSFGIQRKSRQSIGAYTSLFARKLLPPLGFYRETDKYAHLKTKFKDDPTKLDAVDEMWDDYQKYQVRKRFRWPPQVFCSNFFWTTGYYADYQKKHRATKLRKPGEDSSEEEFFDPAGQYFVAGGDDDINMEEFERYREAKKNADPSKFKRRSTRFKFDNAGDNNEEGPTYMVDKRPTVARLFNDGDSGGGRESRSDPRKSQTPEMGKEVEEVETVVEYTVIRDPNKKKKKKQSVAKTEERDHRRSHRHDDGQDNGNDDGHVDGHVDGINIEDLKISGGKKIITHKRRSIASINPATGEKFDVKEYTDTADDDSKQKRKEKRKSRR